MIGLVIAGDGPLIDGVIGALQIPMADALCPVETLAVSRAAPLEAQRSALHRLVLQTDRGEGVLVLVDVEDGLAGRLAQSQMGQAIIAVVSGINLPMLLTVLEQAHRLPLSELATLARDAGRRGIVMTAL